MGPDPGICPWVPIRLGCRQLPKASSAFSHAAILAPGTAAGSLHAPRKTLQTRPAHFSCPGGSRRPGSSWAPEPRMGCCLQSQLPQVSFQRARRLLQVCSAGRAAARRVLGGGRRGARAEGGEGKDAGAGFVVGGGAPGGGGAGARGLGATFLQTTLPHAESTEISGALEGIVSGREKAGDHTALEENTLNSSSWLTFGEREETRMKEPVEGGQLSFHELLYEEVYLSRI
ncbi:zinc finger X-linked protein ZXDB-like isoform X2 [Nomascus leucogenys]|uniref:zinc finger X-linked protein ZXDB-like isoform X2 n=1 Tax=Nomascus leucogenys TaxID=61853 RepID=UPI00122D8813|nr:zinc finger X-linked protein ZXDB-like isoform X2 [Nomascus leucogenys]